MSGTSATGRILGTVVALVLLLAGATFTLQGLGILKGSSFMVGDPLWAVIGAGLIVVAVALLRRVLRRGPVPLMRPDETG